jgi:hypothetical protein
MNRFAKLTLAAGAALSISAFAALPASAMDILVPIKGKTTEEIKTDIRAAAVTICRDGFRDALLGQLATCIEMVYDDAMTRVPTVAMPAAN